MKSNDVNLPTEAEVRAAYREEAEVDGVSAIFAVGAPGNTPAEAAQSWHVQDPASAETLYWRSSGWDYVLVSTGVEVKRDLLITIAASLK